MSLPHRATARRAAAGFTLIEIMVVISVVGILAAIAYPSYASQVVRTRRAAASGCLLEMAQFMERVYASNLRYDQNAGAATALPVLACTRDTSASYSYGFAAGQPQSRTFTVVATPTGIQSTKDTACARLSIDQANTRGISGTGTVADCWR